MKKIFVSRNDINTVYEGEYYYYLIVKSKKYEEWVGAFDGNIFKMYKNKWATVAEHLIEFISNEGCFYIDNITTPRTSKPRKRIDEVLHMIYHIGDSDMSAKHDNVRLGNRRRITVKNSFPEDEIAFLNENEVFDLSAQNIRYSGCGTVGYNQGSVFNGMHGIEITCKGMHFYTGWDSNLYKILRQITSWNIHYDTLKAHIKGKEIAFSTIVWAYHTGKLSINDNINDTIVAVHNELVASGREIDHLTENKANNYEYVLSAVKRKTNVSMGIRRTGIIAPYYFYTVSDNRANRLLVQCGIEDGHYEKKYAFDLSTNAGDEQYRKCFNEFKSKIEKGGESQNLLSKWSKPERMMEKNNPLNLIMAESIDNFCVYEEGAFSDMPDV